MELEKKITLIGGLRDQARDPIGANQELYQQVTSPALKRLKTDRIYNSKPYTNDAEVVYAHVCAHANTYMWAHMCIMY